MLGPPGKDNYRSAVPGQAGRLCLQELAGASIKPLSTQREQGVLESGGAGEPGRMDTVLLVLLEWPRSWSVF